MDEVTGKCLGEAIRSARKKAGMTQEELAALIRIDPRTYQKYEAGDVLPRYKTLFKIAQATGANAPELLKPMWEAWAGR